MSVSYWMDRSNEKKLASFDMVIIGGGIAGLSSAFWLKKEDPSLQIAVVEKYQCGDGATGRNAGFITCGSVEHFNRLVGKHGEREAREMWHFSEINLALLKEHIIGKDEKEILFEQKGSFSLASTDNEFRELKNSADIMKGMGIDVEIIEEEKIVSRLGALNFVGGIKYLGDASVHPLKLLNLLQKKLIEMGGVTFFENHEVSTIQNKGDNKIIHTRSQNFETPMVILATNGYSPLLNNYFNDKIYPTRGQILATEAVPHFMEGPCYANFVLDYFRQLPTGQMIIGGFRQLQKDAEIGYSDQISDVIQSSLEKFLEQHIPAVRPAKITHRWSGVMGFSVDGQPLVGLLPTDNQIAFVGGFTGHGIGLAFHCSRKLVDSLYGRSIPRWLSAKRFS